VRRRANVASRNPLEERLRALPRTLEPPAEWWPEVAVRLGATPPGAAVPPLPRPAAEWELGAHRLAWIAAPSRAWGVRPALAAALVLALGAAMVVALPRGGPAWHVLAASGAADLAPARLETGPGARVRLAAGRLGEVDVAPGSLVRLLPSRGAERRLALDRGALAVRIAAPPRLFAVETPSATAVDLGCAYTLAVDPRGGSLIHVTVGWVELSGRGSRSVVPFNMSAYTRPGRAPGTPFADRAPDSLKAALFRFEFEGGGTAALRTVLDEARPDDAITLWHLLARTAGTTRAEVYRRLVALAPPAAASGVTEAGVLALDQRQLRAWWDELPGSPGTPSWWERLAARLARWTGSF